MMQHDPFEHAMRVLSLDAVLARVAAGCVNAAARDTVLATRPTSDPERIRTGLSEIGEYRRLREQSGDVAIPETAYRPEVERIAAGERGSGEALRRIADGERAVMALRRGVTGAHETFPLLAGVAAAAVPHEALVVRAERTLEPDGAVKDDATPELRALRHDIRTARTRLRERADRMVGDLGADAHATMLGGRHVLVVPRQKVKKGAGLVHGASQTGGSLYLEPIALLDLNNELETRLADEAEEVDRILAALSEEVRRVAPEILGNADVVDTLDAIRARAAFAETFGCVAPEITPGARVRLVRARHPLLTLALERSGTRDGQVPLDVTLEPASRLLVITGPNAGGKTVALKTVGLFSLMLQCGLPLPCAHGSEMPVFDRVLVDIGDEQSLESSLSTFTSHLKHLDEMTRLADAHTLCLVDEIGDGTDPDEGAAIAIATLERLLASNAAVIATTHYGRIKTWALETPGVANASMAFEDAQARPLYTLRQGVAGRSRGLETARRTGFDAAVVTRAEELLGGEAFRLESALARVEETYTSLVAERDALARERADLERSLAAAREKEQAYALTKKEATRRAAREAEDMIAEARRGIEDVVRQLREKKADAPTIRESRKRVDTIHTDVRARTALPDSATPLASVAVGDRVSLSPTGEPSGIVVSVERKDAMVEVGGKRIRVRVGKLYAAGREHERGAAPAYHVEYEPVSETEVHVRGMDREEALDRVNKFLDRAVLTGLHEVKIVHGLGEGILARAVHATLARDPRVTSYRFGNSMEGGNGVTFAALK